MQFTRTIETHETNPETLSPGEVRIRTAFGFTDDKGRQLGYIAKTYTDSKGTLCAMRSPTRDRKTFGPYTGTVEGDTLEAVIAKCDKLAEDCAKRYFKKYVLPAAKKADQAARLTLVGPINLGS